MKFKLGLIALVIKPFEFTLPLLEHDAVTVSCVAQGVKSVDFEWFKNGNPFKEVKPRVSIMSSAVISTLMINEVHPEDVGNFTCQANANQEQATHSASLILSYAPKWLIEPEDVLIKSDQNRQIVDCQAYGSPKPKITWKLNTEGN